MSALTKAANTPTTKLCSVGEARTKLDTASAADFDAWMDGKPVADDDGNPVKMTDIAMWNALQGLGHRVGVQTVGRHRRQAGECGCRP